MTIVALCDHCCVWYSEGRGLGGCVSFLMNQTASSREQIAVVLNSKKTGKNKKIKHQAWYVLLK